MIATINGMRLLIGGIGDGGVYAIKPQTGEKVWGYVVVQARHQHRRRRSSGNTVIVSHGDENLDVDRARHDRGDRRIADRRHQDDEVGA